MPTLHKQAQPNRHKRKHTYVKYMQCKYETEANKTRRCSDIFPRVQIPTGSYVSIVEAMSSLRGRALIGFLSTTFHTPVDDLFLN